MTTAEIISFRLQNQQITRSVFTTPQQVVAWMGAMQAQEYAMARWAVGLRLPGSTDASVEAAFNRGDILRTHILRPTWHFVNPADIRWLLALTAPRVHQLNKPMYRKLELDATLCVRSKNILSKVLEGGKQLTREELGQSFKQYQLAAQGHRLAYLIMQAELDGLICSGARKGKQFTYALLDERVPPAKIYTREEALAELVKRYFASRCPATLQDFAYWSGLTVRDAREGVWMNKPYLVEEYIDGKAYIFSADLQAMESTMPATFLMPVYDEYGISYKNRSALLPSVDFPLEDIVFDRMIVVNGQIAGTWNRTIQKENVLIQLQLIQALNEYELKEVMNAVQRLAAFLDKKVSIEFING
ncbi:winged helix DNA-binding domain-containing protein [Rhodocytophaga aerolata]|uniref:Winged helix DNA-binding domain-containing protein n=1 Tax=Rhodocytophaga aerolata TaxID=455078 RepID=A0ABT8R7V4_9BACT|nr:winged helix DNA-binding domain-containing protein [Rhodocytophaga aerolata]MDO1448186.1 winged helix DNA-binding domain-containing protein [Rhodocytophaga aerolata]